MAIKRYSVTLEEEIVKKAKNFQIESGGKLSPLINSFLKKWIKEKEGCIDGID